jgi:hypothetical protein
MRALSAITVEAKAPHGEQREARPSNHEGLCSQATTHLLRFNPAIDLPLAYDITAHNKRYAFD